MGEDGDCIIHGYIVNSNDQYHQGQIFVVEVKDTEMVENEKFYVRYPILSVEPSNFKFVKPNVIKYIQYFTRWGNLSRIGFW